VPSGLICTPRPVIAEEPSPVQNGGNARDREDLDHAT
jgi:hypothetical protein